jgi:hypothetical protein
MPNTPAPSLAVRRDAMADLARFTLDPVERLVALTASERMDAAAIESEYEAALSDLLEASR